MCSFYSSEWAIICVLCNIQCCVFCCRIDPWRKAVYCYDHERTGQWSTAAECEGDVEVTRYVKLWRLHFAKLTAKYIVKVVVCLSVHLQVMWLVMAGRGATCLSFVQRGRKLWLGPGYDSIVCVQVVAPFVLKWIMVRKIGRKISIGEHVCTLK